MGALEWVLGKVQQYDLLQDLQPYGGVRGALPGLLPLLLRLGYTLDLWGALEPTCALVLAWECLALIASESWVEASRGVGYYWESESLYL